MEEKQIIFKTREGISLYFDGAAFHTENIEMVKTMTFEEVLKSDFTEVVVHSYGYDVVGLFGHYEPFGNSGRDITFYIDRNGEILYHEWLWFDNESDEVFEVKDGILTCFDPKLCARDQ